MTKAHKYYVTVSQVTTYTVAVNALDESEAQDTAIADAAQGRAVPLEVMYTAESTVKSNNPPIEI